MLKPQSKGGFTIVELLIAAAISIIIVVLLGTMFGSITKTTARSNQQIDAFRDARAALQMISRDLAKLVRTQWDPDPFTIPPPASGSQARTRPIAYLVMDKLYSSSSNNQEIYGLIALANTGSGDACAVGYYSSWDGKAYSLRRFFRNSTDTYNTIAAQASYVSQAKLYTPNATGTNPDDILAQYVWNMKVIAYDSSGAALSYPYVCDPSSSLPVPPPAAIEISFSAISSEAAKTVMSVTSDPADWDPSQNTPTYQRLIKPSVYQFRTRVAL